MSAIKFYRARDIYGCFSNFFRRSIELDGKTWPSSEHYYQAQKFAGTDHEEFIRYAARPGAAASMGRDPSRPLRPDWEAAKDDVMRKVVLAKFEQHDDLRAILLGTGDAEIVEHTKRDAYWGDAGDGTGKNMLGKILMGVREELRSRVVS